MYIYSFLLVSTFKPVKFNNSAGNIENPVKKRNLHSKFAVHSKLRKETKNNFSFGENRKIWNTYSLQISW